MDKEELTKAVKEILKEHLEVEIRDFVSTCGLYAVLKWDGEVIYSELKTKN